jgi:hypothetical protein
MAEIVGALRQAESNDDTSATCFPRLRCLAPSKHVSGYRSQKFVQRLISMSIFTETEVVFIRSYVSPVKYQQDCSEMNGYLGFKIC